MANKKKTPTIKVGDAVQIINGIPEWEKALTHFVVSVNDDEIKVASTKDGGIFTTLSSDDIIKI